MRLKVNENSAKPSATPLELDMRLGETRLALKPTRDQDTS